MALLQGPLLFDGAMGTMLQQKRSDLAFPELFNLEAPEIVEEVHRAYLAAGADVVETNTFGANRYKLAQHGLAERTVEINERAAELAKEAVRKAGGKQLVAGSLGPTGQLMAPLGTASFEDIYGVYREQAQALAAGGVDLLIVETMLDLGEARAALLGALTTGLPVIAQMTFEQSGMTMMGTPAAVAACVLSSLGATVVGTNCGLGPRQMLDIVRSMAEVAPRISAIPNAGLPKLVEGKDVYDLDPKTMAEFVPQLLAQGAGIVGGCCGTTPDHIQAMRQALDAASYTPPTPRGIYGASSRKLVDLSGGVLAKAGTVDDWMEAEGAGFSLLVLTHPGDVTMAQMMCPLPMIFTDVPMEDLEKLLREYHGRALVVPPMEPEQQGFAEYLEVLGRYGALAVLSEYRELGVEVAVWQPLSEDTWRIEGVK
ncbi:MAG TPA: hypothetical protein GXX57_01200 [Firmicutes bacterium]|jgi:methionine synthase I (cobalamin-dependent)|nr:hypothetical protein [Bacillota bacterium]